MTETVQQLEERLEWLIENDATDKEVAEAQGLLHRALWVRP